MRSADLNDILGLQELHLLAESSEEAHETPLLRRVSFACVIHNYLTRLSPPPTRARESSRRFRLYGLASLAHTESTIDVLILIGLVEAVDRVVQLE